MERYHYLTYLVNYINFECLYIALSLSEIACSCVRMKRVLSVLPIYVD